MFRFQSFPCLGPFAIPAFVLCQSSNLTVNLVDRNDGRGIINVEVKLKPADTINSAGFPVPSRKFQQSKITDSNGIARFDTPQKSCNQK
jgi:hypothetical protein